MSALELKIPPPLVALGVALSMWAVARLGPHARIDFPYLTLAGASVALLGGGISLLGALTFRRARTTVNPLRPEKASALVTNGIFRITRNPMYLGLAFALTGWAAHLAKPWPLIGPAIFVAFINRFQIAPEERILSSKFGAQYQAYRTRVRRWL